MATRDSSSLRRMIGIGDNKTGHLEKWVSAAGGMAGMLAVAWISQLYFSAIGVVLVVASMGASAVLLFAVPHAPLSQPWPVLGGHAISAVIGVICAQWIPDTVIAAAASVAVAIGVMHYLQCLHPPGGATALSAVVGGQHFHDLGFQYVLTPVLMSAAAILFVAIVFNNAFPWRRYPAALADRLRQRSASEPGAAVDDMPLARSDLEMALKTMNRVIDISSDDLNRIFQLALRIARARDIDPMQLQPGQYYSNDHHDHSWQVRQIIDMDSTAKSAQDTLIYKVVAGHQLHQTGSITREEFAHWARYPVFQQNGAWLHTEGSARPAPEPG